MGKPDTGGKKIINIYNQAWVEWILQRQSVEVEAELSGSFQFIGRATDSLLQVKGSEGRFLVLTELQFRYESDMPNRLLVYAGLARRQYNQPVFITVVYLLPPPRGQTPATAFHQEFMGQTARQDFQVIALWELEAEQVLAFDNPALLPFAPLMQGGASVEIVRRCAERIRQEPQALELETILALFASYVLDTEVIKQILRWEMEIVKESPLIRELYQIGFEEGRQEGHEEGRQEGLQEGRQEGLQEGRQEGLQEGRQEGLQEGQEEGARNATIKGLYQILSVRFETTFGEFDERFEQLDLASLERLLEVALTVQTLVAFEKALAEMVAKSAVEPERSGGDEPSKKDI